MGCGGNLVLSHLDKRWAIFIPPGFPGSCPSACGQPGCWERTTPAAVPIEAAKVKTTVDSQGL